MDMSVSEPYYDRFEDPWYVHGPIALLFGSVLIERTITLLFWHLEANPLVLRLGIFKWTILTLLALAGILFLWYPNMGFQYKLNRLLVYSLALYHIAAAGTNVYVVIFV